MFPYFLYLLFIHFFLWFFILSFSFIFIKDFFLLWEIISLILFIFLKITFIVINYKIMKKSLRYVFNNKLDYSWHSFMKKNVYRRFIIIYYIYELHIFFFNFFPTTSPKSLFSRKTVWTLCLAVFGSVITGGDNGVVCKLMEILTQT